MTDFHSLLQPDRGQASHSLRLTTESAWPEALAALSATDRLLIGAQRFTGNAGEMVALPIGDGLTFIAGAPDALGPWDLAGIAAKLPAGTYRIEGRSPGIAALGWLLAQYRFARYLKRPESEQSRVLLTSEPADIGSIIDLADATGLVRDLVNTPALDLGPAALQAEAERIAADHDATVTVIIGDALEQGYPMIHAVGMAAERSRAPRLIELEWGNPDHPRIAIIGKGVCFDSGGLDIKPSSGMRLMKKDMGGAAHALALAQLIMKARLPVRLHMLVPAVENSIAGNAFRPGDVLRSRKGLTVEIDNTDAEGRLVLADALTRAGENSPELIVDFATLTGAARTALGPDLPALFCNDHGIARQISEASVDLHDPVWRLPLWTGYDDMLASDIADLANSADSGMGGAITAALFLRRFVPEGAHWAHLDTFAWRQKTKPGRPKGGDALGLRAVFAMLKARYPSA